MEKMDVITFSKTGQILGAVTRASQPDRPVTVADVAPRGVVLRDDQGAGVQVRIGPDALAAQRVDYDTRVLYHPQRFALVEKRAEEQTKAVDVTSISATVNGSTINVDLGVPVAGGTEVFVHVSGGALSEPVVRAVSVPDGAQTGSESLTLGSGSYVVVVFAPGFGTLVQAPIDV